MSFIGSSGVGGKDMGRGREAGGGRRWREAEDGLKSTILLSVSVREGFTGEDWGGWMNDSSCQGWNMRTVRPSLKRSRESWGTEKMILYS